MVFIVDITNLYIIINFFHYKTFIINDPICEQMWSVDI